MNLPMRLGLAYRSLSSQERRNERSVQFLGNSDEQPTFPFREDLLVAVKVYSTARPMPRSLKMATPFTFDEFQT
jgi:hypothetical protein